MEFKSEWIKRWSEHAGLPVDEELLTEAKKKEEKAQAINEGNAKARRKSLMQRHLRVLEEKYNKMKDDYRKDYNEDYMEEACKDEPALQEGDEPALEETQKLDETDHGDGVIEGEGLGSGANLASKGGHKAHDHGDGEIEGGEHPKAKLTKGGPNKDKTVEKTDSVLGDEQKAKPAGGIEPLRENEEMGYDEPMDDALPMGDEEAGETGDVDVEGLLRGIADVLSQFTGVDVQVAGDDAPAEEMPEEMPMGDEMPGEEEMPMMEGLSAKVSEFLLKKVHPKVMERLSKK